MIISSVVIVGHEMLFRDRLRSIQIRRWKPFFFVVIKIRAQAFRLAHC